jgi:hypothetical protein
MTTTHQPENALTTHAGVRPRRGSAAALAAGTVLTATALSLHLRGGTPESVEFARRVEDAPGIWITGHVLMAVGGILLLVGMLAVPGLVHGRGRRAVLVGTGMCVIGAASSALGDFAHGSLAYVLVGEVSAEQSIEIQKQFFYHPLLAGVSMPGLLLPVGILVLGGALLYARAVPVPAGLLLLAAPITIQLGYMVTTLPMPVMVVPLIAGLGWVALIMAGRAR